MKDRDKKIAKEYRAGTRTGIIAEKYGIHPSTVRQALVRQGVDRRPEGRQPVYDYDRIVELYRENESTTAVAAEVGCTADTVRRALRSAGIEFAEDRPAIDADEVVRLYTEEGLTQEQIADRMGSSQTMVSHRLRAAGLTYLDRGAGRITVTK